MDWDGEELDGLLALEEDLLFGEEDQGGRKRSFQDAASAREAAGSLGPASASKRTRIAGGPRASGADLDDDELLELAASEPQYASAAALDLGATEEQEWLLLAEQEAGSQPHGGSQQLRAGAPRSSHQPGRTTDLLALAGQPPTSQSDAAAAALGSAQRPGQSEAELDAAIEELLREDGPPPAAAAAAAAAQRAQQGRPQRAAAEAEVIPRRNAPPPAWDVLSLGNAAFMTVTNELGERVYCQLDEAQPAWACGRVDVNAMLRRCRGRLLSTDIYTLLAAVEQENYNRAVAEAEVETAAGAAAAARGAEDAQAGPSSSGRGRGAQEGRGHGAAGSSLWVHKYAPKTFWDLLSDEQINREVVRWLKGWDPCVFGRPAPAAPQQQGGGGGKTRGAGATGGGGGQFGKPAGAAAPDPLGRPEHKVILLAGPPGLGKTTLAHVVARHCGYRPLEINASDDRSSTALSTRIADAVEMRAVMGERRPNCVIIDEIDGATGGAEGRSAIAALIKIINAAPAKGKKGGRGGGQPGRDQAEEGGGDDSGSEDEGEEEEGGSNGGGSGSRKARRGGSGSPGRQGEATAAGAGRRGGGARRPLRPLMRPIICICNDLYAPPLRPLRDVAKVFHFRKPQAERLAQRLQVVCGWEGLHADKSALRGLVDRTDCDIRACLNTLQFVAKRCTSGVVRAVDLATAQVGQKDMTKGAFAVWQDLLQKRMQQVGIGKRMEGDAERHARLFNVLMDFGEQDLVLSGVHENVLGLRYMDVALGRTCQVVGQLADADRLLRAAHRGGDFGLQKYVPAALVTVSMLVAGHERPQLQWPKAGADAWRRGAANRALLQGWMLGIDPHILAATGPEPLVQEVLPSLLHITAPPLRPVSRHLYTPEEQHALAGVVGTLLGYGLRFAQEGQGDEEEEEGVDAASQRELALRGVRAQQQEPPMRFKPHVHRLWQFPGLQPRGRRLPMSIRLLLTHEADMEAIRRAEAARHGGAGPAAEPGPSPLAAVGGPRERDANVPPQPAAGRMVATLAERMKGAQQQGIKKAPAAAPRGTWLDQLKAKQLQKRAAGAAGGGAAGSPGGSGKAGRMPVLYKFHEGYTNAVKRPIKVSELL